MPPSPLTLEDGVNWYLEFLFMSGASAAAVIDMRENFFHLFRKLYDLGVISDPVVPALPKELYAEQDEVTERSRN